MQKYEALVFDRSIVKLDILQLEKEALDLVQQNAVTWYGRDDRVTTVQTYITE